MNDGHFLGRSSVAAHRARRRALVCVCVVCAHLQQGKRLELCMRERWCECACMQARACDNDYRFPYL